MIRLEGITKTFPGVKIPGTTSTFEAKAGEIHAPAGRERRRQVDADQDHRGILYSRRGHHSFRRPAAGLVRPARGQGRGHPCHLPGIDPVPRIVGRREHLHRRRPPHEVGPDRSQGDARERQRDPGSPGPPSGSARPGQGPVGGGSADGRNRQGPDRRHQASGTGRADRRDFRARGRTVVRTCPDPARRGCLHHLYLAPPGRDLPDR